MCRDAAVLVPAAVAHDAPPPPLDQPPPMPPAPAPEFGERLIATGLYRYNHIAHAYVSSDPELREFDLRSLNYLIVDLYENGVV